MVKWFTHASGEDGKGKPEWSVLGNDIDFKAVAGELRSFHGSAITQELLVHSGRPFVSSCPPRLHKQPSESEPRLQHRIIQAFKLNAVCLQLLQVLEDYKRHQIELWHPMVICSWASYGPQCQRRLHGEIEAGADPEGAEHIRQETVRYGTRCYNEGQEGWEGEGIQKNMHLGTYHWWEERKWQKRNVAAKLWMGFNVLISQRG